MFAPFLQTLPLFLFFFALVAHFREPFLKIGKMQSLQKYIFLNINFSVFNFR